MGEYNEQTSHPNLYERLAPEYRFVRISNAIIEQIGSSTTPNGGKTKLAIWQDKQSGHHFKLQAITQSTVWSRQSTNYYLEHFIDDLPNSRPVDCYTASSSGTKISAIGVFNTEGKPIHEEPSERRNSIRQLLQILREVAPHNSDKLLDEIFTARYDSLIGAYVLSDLALEGTKEEITELEAWQCAEDHTERVTATMESVLEKSSHDDSPAKQEAIKEAVLHSRTKTNKNRYEPVNPQAAAERVAKEIGKKWKYTVSPEQ